MQVEENKTASLEVFFLLVTEKAAFLIFHSNFPCISMDMLQNEALVLLGRLVEAYCHNP